MKNRILHIVSRFEGGGAAKVFQETVIASSQQYDNYIFFTDDDISDREVKKKINAISSINNKVNNSFCYVYNNTAKKKFKKIIAEIRPDIIHFHDRGITGSVIPLLKELKAKGIGMVETHHSFYNMCPNSMFFNLRNNCVCEKCLFVKPEKRYLKIIIDNCSGKKYKSYAKSLKYYIENVKNNRFVDFMDLVVAPSRFMAEKLEADNISKQKIAIILNPYEKSEIDISDIENINSRGIDFLYVGRLSKEKNVKMLIDAVRIVNEKQGLCYFDIIGDGPEREVLEKYIRDENIKGIKMHGTKSYEEVQKYYRASKICIVPSCWYENCPLALVEGISYGLFPISSNHGGMAEIIEKSDYGIKVNPFSCEEIAQALIQAFRITKRLDKNEMTENIKKIVEEYSINKYRLKILELYEECNKKCKSRF